MNDSTQTHISIYLSVHVKRAKSVLSKSDIATLYSSHVRSTLEYCSPIWMGTQDTAIARLDKVQSRALTLMTCQDAKKFASLSHRRDTAALRAMHRIVHGLAPEPLLSLCPPRAAASVRRSARQGPPLMFAQPSTNSVQPNYWRYSFIPLLTVAWNKLPTTLQTLSSPSWFKRATMKITSTISFSQLGRAD